MPVPVLAFVWMVAQVPGVLTPNAATSGSQPPQPRPAVAPKAVEVTAAVAGLKRVKTVRLPDPFVGWYEEEPGLKENAVLLQISEPACLLQLRPETSLSRSKEGPDLQSRLGRTLDAWVAPELCTELRFGDRLKTQVFGAGPAFRVVALEIDDMWRELPLMTLTLSPEVGRCLKRENDVEGWCPRLRKTGEKTKRRPW